MSTISFDRRTIGEALQKKYSLPTYQRDYKWTDKQVRELISDIQEAFLSSYKPEHGRKEVATYEEYFLGTIITTESADTTKSIIDGQQRLSTMTLLLAYFQRKKLLNAANKMADLDNLIRKESFGEKDYNLSFEGSRAKLFDKLLDPNITEDDMPAEIDTIANIDTNTLNMFSLYLKIDEYLDSQVKTTILPNFVDYVTERVLIFEIGVPTEQDAHRVFVTMNDRGLKLGPIDLLKGYLLSNINDDDANSQSHENWVTMVNSLKQIDPDLDTQFLKTWLRACYAETIRGKNRGDIPGDFENIGTAYHRWVVDNRDKLRLTNSDDYQSLLSEILPKYAGIFKKIILAEKEFSDSLQHVYYNGVRNLTLQPMLIMSTILPKDTDVIVTKKIKIISYYLDIFATTRIINGQDNTYDNTIDLIFEATKRFRGKETEELKKQVIANIDSMLPTIDKVVDLDYTKTKRQDLLHVLARIASQIESLCSQTNSVGFPNYIDRTRGLKTFDIEHILCENPDENKTNLAADWDFATNAEYISKRNLIGGLILLPRGRNRSLNDQPYSKKLSVYATENILCQTLHDSFYTNNPTAVDALNGANLPPKSINKFNNNSIKDRAEFYTAISKMLWTKEFIEKI